MSPQDLDQYVEWVLSQKDGYAAVDDAVKAELKKAYLESLEDQVNAAIVKALPPEQLEAFDQVLASQDDKAMADFCEQHIPNLKEVVAAELVSFKENYVGA